MDLVSVIVLNYNGRIYIDACLESIRNQTYKDIEIFFLDNNSSDASREYVRCAFPDINFMFFKENLGYAEANNRAAEEARGKYLFFLNIDTRIDKNCISELVKKAEIEPRIGALGCKTLMYNGDPVPGYCDLSCDIFGLPVAGETAYIEGVAFFIRRDIFFEVGQFDPRHFLFYEDIDLSWRLALRRYKIERVNSALVCHESGGSSGASSMPKEKIHKTTIQRRYFSERNAIRNMIKNYSFFMLLSLMPIYIFLNILEAVFFLVRGEFKMFRKVYLEAYVDNIKMFPETWKMHSEIQKSRIVGERTIWKMRKKSYSKLESLFKIGIPKIQN